MKDNINKLDEKQKKIIEKNIGLLKKFYKSEVKKRVIHYKYYDDFFSLLQLNFCGAAKNYNEETGFKFSTFAYKSMEFAKQDILKYIYKNKKSISFSEYRDYICSKNNHNRERKPWVFSKKEKSQYLLYDKIIELIESSNLEEKEEKIIKLRFCEGRKLKEIGDEFNVTDERIRQIIIKAIDKIKMNTRINNYNIDDFIETRV